MSVSIHYINGHCYCNGDNFHDITYNLSKMLTEAGYRGHRNNEGRSARAYGRHLLKVYLRLKNDPDRFEEFNPPNGWGTYEICLQWAHDTAICASLQGKRVRIRVL